MSNGHGLIPAVVAAVVALCLLMPGLGAAPLDDPGEGQHAEIARELLAGGDWVTLRLNGVRYFDKPPLLYWMTAAAFEGFGVTEWSARLAPVLGAALAAAGTAILGARLLGPFWGLGAACGLLSMALFVAFGGYLRPETLFVAAIQWGFTGFILADAAASETAARRWRLAGCAALGVAALAKDPVGLLGPLAALAIARALAPRTAPPSRWMSWPAIAVLVVVGFGWYALAASRNAGFAWYTAVDNHLLNAVRMRQFPDEDVPLSSLEFLGVSALGAFPWIIPAALAVASLARRRAWRDPAETPWVALALWAVGVFAVFAVIPFKLPHYALPAYPAIALLAARGWRDRTRRARGLIAVHAVLIALLAAGCAAAAWSDGRWFTDLVFSAADVQTRKEAVIGEASSLPPWPALQPVVARSAVVLGLTSAALAAALAFGGGRLGAAVTLAGMLCLMPSVRSGARPGRVGTGRRGDRRRGRARDEAGRRARPRGPDRELRGDRVLLRASARSSRRPAQRARHRRDLRRRVGELLGRRPVPARVDLRRASPPASHATIARAQRRRGATAGARPPPPPPERPLALRQRVPVSPSSPFRAHAQLAGAGADTLR